MAVNLPSNVLDVLRQEASVLRTELEGALRDRNALDEKIAVIQTDLGSLDNLIGETRVSEIEHSTKEERLQKPTATGAFEKNVRRLSLGKAALEVLKSQQRPMTAAEVLDVLRKAGRSMRSPNSRDMVSGALKHMPDKVEVQKDGHANLYKAK